MDTGRSVELCLGAVMESYPPQCRGIPLSGWTWDGVEGGESAGDVRWGAYAVQGTFDGADMRMTQAPILLALYDPPPLPPVEPSPSGSADEATLHGIRDELAAALEEDLLMASPQDGRLHVDVVWDDGTLQDQADAAYGMGVVVVRSALRTVRD